MARFIEVRGFNKGNCFAVPEVRLTKTVHKFAFFQGGVFWLFFLSLSSLCCLYLHCRWFLLRILAEVLITATYQHFCAGDHVC